MQVERGRWRGWEYQYSDGDDHVDDADEDGDVYGDVCGSDYGYVFGYFYDDVYCGDYDYDGQPCRRREVGGEVGHWPRSSFAQET